MEDDSYPDVVDANAEDINQLVPSLENQLPGMSRGKPQGAMQGLARLVSTDGNKGLRQDIKRVRKAETLSGARKWAAKRKSKDGPYRAVMEDIDDDGVADVIVKDAKGRLIVVNGYTVRPTTYPYRQIFKELPEEERKAFGNSYKNYFNNRYQAVHDPKTGKIIGYNGMNPEDDKDYTRIRDAGFRTYAPKNQTPFELFSKQISHPLVKAILTSDPGQYAYAGDGSDEHPHKFPTILLECAGYAWNLCVVRPILEHVTGTRISPDLPPDVLHKLFAREDIAKYKKTKEFKSQATELVHRYVVEDQSDNEIRRMIDELIMDRLSAMIMARAEEWLRQKGYRLYRQ